MDAVRFSQIQAPDLGEPRTPGAGAAGFGELLKQGMEKVSSLQAEADSRARRLMAGEPVELHRVVLAGEEAALAFELTMSVRNKIVEAYQEVMRMQV